MSVDIDFIKTTSCPICGCQTVVTESVETEVGGQRIRKHVNGAKWEMREFACGYRVSYIPNYLREEVTHGCANDPELGRMREMMAQTKAALYQQIDASGCDDKFKERLKEAIKYT